MAEKTKILIPSFSYHSVLASKVSKETIDIPNIDLQCDEIESIADGELVAYRINDNKQKDDDLYSNGFFLIKHKIKYANSKLTFFSLYINTAKKDEYYTHKISGEAQYLRKTIQGGKVHSLNSKAFGKKIIIDSKWYKKRTKVLFLEGQELSEEEPAYVHKSNIELIKKTEAFSNISLILSGAINEVVVLSSPIKIKAGEIIGLAGQSIKSEKKLLHIEVFTSDDIKSFSKKAKTTFVNDTNENKLQANKLNILKDTKIYTLEKKLFVDSKVVGYTNLRKAYKNTQSGYKIIKKLSHNQVIEIDKSTLKLNRCLVTKIEGSDVSNEKWTIHKNFYKKRTIFKNTENRQKKDIILNLDDIKKIKDIEAKEYVLLDDKKAVCLKDCKLSHTIIFDWVKVFKTTNKDIALFNKCKEIKSFPQSDTFYNINPISLVSQFSQVSSVSSKTGSKLTLKMLKNIDKYTSKSNREKHINGLCETFEKFEINTALRKVHFLAQVLHESAHLRATSEYGGSSASYAPYYGRGLIQLTHLSNYKSYSKNVGEDLYSTEEKRKKLELNPHAAQTAGWYWKYKANLNDEADNNDLLAITYKVNGGFNGFKDRYRILKNAVNEFSLTISTTYDFKDSWIFNNYKASLAWGLWHDNKSKKFKEEYCDASSKKAKEAYKRFIKLVIDDNISFPIKRSNGRIKKFYGYSNPKKYVEGRLNKL